MSCICAVETSGRQGSVALAKANQLLASHVFRTDYNHAVELLPALNRLCLQVGWRPDQLEEIYVSVGPGSFTGLRIAVTMARMLAATVGTKIVAVPTLKVIAQNALEHQDPPDHLGVVLDAKRGQVYAASFERRGRSYRMTSEPAVRDPSGFISMLAEPRWLTGSGIRYHKETLAKIPHETMPERLWSPHAQIVHILGLAKACRGEYTPADKLRPLYLRRSEAEEKWDSRRPG